MFHRGMFGLAAITLLAACHQAQAAPQAATEAVAQGSRLPAAVRLNELGPENGAMARGVGRWDVTETSWDGPGAAAQVTRGLIAERRMVGQMLEETLSAAADPQRVLRMDYLSFNRVERRWPYVSIETRAPVGLMTAQSYGRDADDRIGLVFQPFAVAGPGIVATGQMLRMRQEITAAGPDRQQKDQYFTLADGASDEWLGHRYVYHRRPGMAALRR